MDQLTYLPQVDHNHGFASSVSVAHVKQSTAQNVGGSNGTISYVDWDDQERVDDGYTHSTSTNPSRVQVPITARYAVTCTVSAQQGGGARTTLRSFLRINGSTIVDECSARNYSRGANYGDLSLSLATELDLTADDYLEVGVEVDDSDSTYTINTFPGECELIVRMLGT